ncbi:MAG TPA: AraC family transcriptional regulator [Polyangiaceae bacterium]|nr:AraC family transcriptional regulator [Polyangiaceae bacterium]
MSAERPWFDEVQSYYWIHNIVHLHRELNFWLIRRTENNSLTWMELNIDGQQIQPFHFEIFYGRDTSRNGYYLTTMEQAAREKRMIVGRLHGFSDLFFPVPGDPEGRTFLHAGQFLTAPPTWEGLCAAWQSITGREPASANPDFVRFVRMALQLPVLSEPVLRGIEQLCLLYSQYLTRSDVGPEHHRRVDEVRREFFVRHWPNLDWIDSAISSEKFRLTPWYHEGKLAEWMREEMKIERLPTTVIALMPLDPPDEERDGVETLVRNTLLQRELIQATFEMPHTAANKLGDYGVFFVTSADPKKSPAAARAELRDRARQIQELARKLGTRTVIGIGQSMPPGEPMATSYQEAVHALHLCVQLEKDVLFFDEKFAGEDRDVRYADVHSAMQTLSDAYDRAASDQIKLASDKYVREVLIYSGERLEVVRSHFLAMVFRLIAGVQKRHSINTKAVDQLADELSQKLEEAASVSKLIETFKEVLSRLSFYASRALEGPKSIRLESSLQFLKDNFAEQLRLPDVAKKAGFSVPAFSRIFRHATGTSFLAYLRNVRVEHAKMLLRTTNLPTAQIAINCGFQSPHHLIRSFKKVTGHTPGDYRRWAKARKGEKE